MVAVALAQARSFRLRHGRVLRLETPGEPPWQRRAARNGFKAWIFVPADLEAAKILGTQVFGAAAGSHRGKLRPPGKPSPCSSQIADEHRWGFVNVNLRPYYAEGSKTVGFEIAGAIGMAIAG